MSSEPTHHQRPAGGAPVRETDAAGPGRLRARAEIDLEAISASVAALDLACGSAAVMAVVKADGYGHGMVPSAHAALRGGATWFGVAVIEEALALRAAGITAPVLSWLAVPGEDLSAGVAANVDLSASAPWAVAQVAAAARQAGQSARLHLKVDTGLSRGGATAADWGELVTAALAAEAEGVLRVVGLWSHLVWADTPTHPTTDAQLEAFRAAVAVAEARGIRPEVRHLANSAATLSRPDTHFDLVRPGLAVYGLSPLTTRPHHVAAADLGLIPAMTLRATVALTKRVPASTGVSYGHRYRTVAETTLALIPLGYADGIPRAATNCGPLLIGGKRHTISGTVCMDQFVVDVGDQDVTAGDDVVLFGRAVRGEPTAEEWAEAIGTINYEIVTRIGARAPRTYLGAAQ